MSLGAAERVSVVELPAKWLNQNIRMLENPHIYPHVMSKNSSQTLILQMPMANMFFFAGFVVCSVFFGICPEYKGFPAQSKNIDHIVDCFIFAVSG